MTPKILLTGTFQAGKTTLLKEFEQISGIVTVAEVAQDLIDQYGLEITLRPEFQDMVFAEQIHRELLAEQLKPAVILCDRGIVDVIAYSQVLGHPVKPEWVATLNGRYDAVAFLNKEDISFDPTLHQANFDVTEYRQAIDQSLRDTLATLHIPTLEVKGTHQERLHHFQEFLFGLGIQEGNYQQSNKERQRR